MATTSATSSSNNIYSAINGTSTTTTKTAAEEQQDRFLTLLVTQLQNQDPLNPMDNAEMTSQMAQMSTVTGIEKLNTTLNSMVDSIGMSQSMQAASMIGKNVLVPGSSLTLNDGIGYAGINLSSPADQVTIKILDSNGKVVQTEEIGAHESGVINIAWDGVLADGTTAADGNYKFTVEAVQDGKAVTATALQIGTVSAITRTSDGFKLDLGALGTVNFSDVLEII
ncbi:MAG: flagellar hook assembly protein FlgD [Propionivibrio sp.]